MIDKKTLVLLLNPRIKVRHALSYLADEAYEGNKDPVLSCPTHNTHDFVYKVSPINNDAGRRINLSLCLLLLLFVLA